MKTEGNGKNNREDCFYFIVIGFRDLEGTSFGYNTYIRSAASMMVDS